MKQLEQILESLVPRQPSPGLKGKIFKKSAPDHSSIERRASELTLFSLEYFTGIIVKRLALYTLIPAIICLFLAITTLPNIQAKYSIGTTASNSAVIASLALSNHNLIAYTVHSIHSEHNVLSSANLRWTNSYDSN